MTGRWGQARRRAPSAMVATRADWRALISLARTCVVDAEADQISADAELRLMALSRRVGGASSSVLDREAGATVADTGRAFLKLTGAFARPATPATTRRALAPVVDAAAVFLDDQLHALNTADFQRAHAGRPEVWN